MTQTVNILIAEDETPLRRSFEALISQVWPAARVVASCGDGEQAIAAFENRSIDIAFLDIRMPGLNGLDVAKQIGQHCFVVFTTAYDEYAVRAFESGAVDYLLKPIEKERLLATISRLEERLRQQTPQDLSGLIDELQARIRPDKTSTKWLTASVGDTLKMIAVEDILYLRSDSKYTRVVTKTDQALLRMPLKQLVEKLDAERFWQVHRSAVVAVDQIDSLGKDELGGWSLKLKSSHDTLPVSKEFKKRFKSL